MKAVNLLPEKDRPFVPTGQRQGSAYVVLGTLGLVLVALVAYVVVANQVTDRRAEAAQARAQTARAEAEAARLGGFQNFAAMKAARTAAVTKLASERFDFERLSLELARVVPEGVFVTEVTASTTGESDSGESAGSGSAPSSGSSSGSSSSGGAAGGGAATGATGGDAGATAPTLQLVGCAPTQSDVATTLVRLRSLHRAEEVSLNDSKRAGSEGAAAGSGSAPPAESGSAPSASSGSAPPAESDSAPPASSSGGAGGCEDYAFSVSVKFAATDPGSADGPADAPPSLGGGA